MCAEPGRGQPGLLGRGGEFVVFVVGEAGVDRSGTRRRHVGTVPTGARAVPVLPGRCAGRHADRQRPRSWGSVRLAARLDPLYQIAWPAALWSPGRATAYPMR